jgi:hypothetical protein
MEATLMSSSAVEENLIPGAAKTSLGIVTDAATQFPGLHLDLDVTEPETCAQLLQRAEGRDRTTFALSALRIGVLAVEQARGRIDADTIRNEGERILDGLRHGLAEHNRATTDEIGRSLAAYFDPKSGRFTDRVERLIRKDGELEQVLHRLVGNNGSELASTLAAHVGADSPLMRSLDPGAADGVVRSIGHTVEETVRAQREAMARELSLDNKDGALCRLVGELTARHGEMTGALEGRLEEVVGEFSLDREDSALSRLVQRVEQAQRQISGEFSLDRDDSALARLRREMVGILTEQQKASAEFQTKVLLELTAMVARREEASKSTRHGHTFEDTVFQQIQSRAANAGDIATRVGNTTGRVKHSKKGDVLVVLGAETVASGARVVIEAKENASSSLKDALAELEEARKNRDAEVGLFIFSAKAAPEGQCAFFRNGNDLVIVWDADDPGCDLVLDAALSVAKALCTRRRAEKTEQTEDVLAIDRAVLEIGRQLQGFEEISGAATTIRNGSDKILTRARIMQSAVAKAVEELTGHVTRLKDAA